MIYGKNSLWIILLEKYIAHYFIIEMCSKWFMVRIHCELFY